MFIYVNYKKYHFSHFFQQPFQNLMTFRLFKKNPPPHPKNIPKISQKYPKKAHKYPKNIPKKTALIIVIL